jgi:prepilin-type N-terminal cleavage/methylation domain-containing protein
MKMKQSQACGFTLVEILIVIGIISILIGLLLPAMAGVRRKAQVTQTQTRLRDVANAITNFQQQEGRLPGYFSTAEMSGVDNSGTSGEGFTEMENILLDLAGGLIPPVEYNANPAKFQMQSNNSYVDVGPVADPNQRVHVDLNRIGSEESNAYLSLPFTEMMPVQGQFMPNRSLYAWTAGPTELNLEFKGMVDVLDSWGQPIMAWRQDPAAAMRPTTVALEAAPGSTEYLDYWASYDFNTKTARPGFFWTTNAGYLAAGEGGIGLGSNEIDQSAKSMIGFATINALGNPESVVQQHLAALLGSPALPLERLKDTDPWRPAQPLGSIVLHSAGPNQVFVENSISRDYSKIQSVRSGTFTPDLGSTVVYAPQGRDPIGYTGGTTSQAKSVGDLDDIIRGSGN